MISPLYSSFTLMLIFLDQRVQTSKHTLIKMETILRSSISRKRKKAINSVISLNKFCTVNIEKHWVPLTMCKDCKENYPLQVDARCCRGITRIHRLPSRPSHPYGRQPHSLIFTSTLYKATCCLPASS